MGNRRAECLGAILGLLVMCISGGSPRIRNREKLDRQYQAAVADYDAGRYAQASAQSQELLPYAPESYEIHELLGMVYALLSQNAQAIDHLKKAVQIKPELAEARTNLGACLLHAGQIELAGEQFRKALALEPKGYDPNHNMGEFLIQTGEGRGGAPSSGTGAANRSWFL